MNCSNEKCQMKEQIEESKVLLGESLDLGLSSEVALKASQDLDKLILKCLKYKLSVKSLDVLDLNSVYGKHFMFLYYDLNHLAFNLERYIEHAVKNNEMILLCIQSDWFEYMNGLGILTENTHYYPVDELIRLNKEKGALAVQHFSFCV